jgi:hypothetical protein
MNNNFISGTLLVMFFIIRIILKFIIEDDIQIFIYKHTTLDVTESEIIENGISLALSFLIVGLINKYSFHSLSIRMNPYLEFVSILGATIIMLIIYELYTKYNGIQSINRGFHINLHD